MACPVVSGSVVTLFVSGAVILVRDRRLRLLWETLLFVNVAGWWLYYSLEKNIGFRISLEAIGVLSVLVCVLRALWLYWVEVVPLPGHEQFRNFSARLAVVFQDPLVLLLKGLLLGFVLVNFMGIVPGSREIIFISGALVAWIGLALLWRKVLWPWLDRIWIYRVCQLSFMRALFARRRVNILQRRREAPAKRCPIASALAISGVENGQ